jgi:hypothetical protein
MWTLNNRTPYGAERTWLRDKQGVPHWLVAVKATFAIAPNGTLSLADEQLPPARAPEWQGEPGKSSLKYDSDIGPMKPSTDVTVIGSACAPRGKVAASVPVRLRCAQIDKSLLVFGDRHYETGPMGLVLSPPAKFAKKAIVYEQAWGGSDHSHADPAQHAHEPRNPVGRGFSKHKSLHNQPAHSIEYPQGLASKLAPAGFGPVDRSWLPRLSHAGTYDGKWFSDKMPLLPDDYDARFELCAPADQQLSDYLYGGEPVELTNFSEDGVLRVTLPKIYLTFATKIRDKVEEHRARLASLILEPDERRLCMVWQTALKVAGNRVEHLDRTTIHEKPYLT